VTCYEQRAKFELTEREQKMDWQMHTYITECNLKEESLKMQLKSLQNQLDQTVKQNQMMHPLLIMMCVSWMITLLLYLMTP
jgi:hypothetical protein